MAVMLLTCTPLNTHCTHSAERGEAELEQEGQNLHKIHSSRLKNTEHMQTGLRPHFENTSVLQQYKSYLNIYKDVLYPN